MKKASFLIIILSVISWQSFCQMDISSGGNVGIGVATPTYKLHVDGNSCLKGNTYFNGNVGIGAANQNITYKLYVDGNAYLSGNGCFNGNVGIGTPIPSQKLHVVGNSYLNGSVGIGFSSPAYKLDVNGSVRFMPPGEGGSSLIIQNMMDDIPSSGGYSQAVCCVPILYPSIDQGGSLGKPDKRFLNIRGYNVSYVNIYNTSDIRVKENIKLCPSLISKLKAVKSYNFNYIDKFYDGFPPEVKQHCKTMQYGFIAQELQEIFPELVSVTDSAGMLGVNYVSMVPILTAVINEQQEMINEQHGMIEGLSKKVMELEKLLLSANPNPKTGETEEINPLLQLNLTQEEKDKEEMVIYQNAPNPFSKTTSIHCYIPKSFNSVQLCVYNIQGEQIKCLNVSERGKVDVQIEAGALSSGIYTYLLIGDGRTSDARNMILTK